MQLLKTVEEMKTVCRIQRKENLSIGFVPTMGALHAGHASLIEAAKKENDFVVVSIFVNPTQFAPTEDLASYPRTLEKDCALAEKMGANAIFAPNVEAMYPQGEKTWVEVTGHLTEILCGRSRPLHFRGVTTIVNKLFNIIAPDRAYFGQKDGQQAQIIRKMVADLFLPVEIRVMPIVREADGLALSSRNVYLSEEERRAGLVLSKSLKEGENLIKAGEKDPAVILNAVQKRIDEEPLAELDYVELYSLPDLEMIEGLIKSDIFLALAVKIGKTRLIDNIVVENK